MTSRVITGVSGYFSASHRSPEGELHGHTWNVVAWFEHRGRADARCDQAALHAVLNIWDHKTLPDELAWGEDIACAIGTLANCIEVEVSRPSEGYHARWTA